MHFKEVKRFHKKLARRYKELVFFHCTLKSSKQKEDSKTNLNSAFFNMRTSSTYFLVMFVVMFIVFGYKFQLEILSIV